MIFSQLQSMVHSLLVAGYYGEDNLGDESYRGIMKNFFPHFTLSFIHTEQLTLEKANEHEGLIVGGGDLVNRYFHDHIHPVLREYRKPKFAFSIGIPFPSLINDEYLGHYDHIFLRNNQDLRAVQKVV